MCFHRPQDLKARVGKDVHVVKLSNPGFDRSGGETGYRRPQTLPQQIAEQLSSAILSGEYAPGDPIKEQQLAAEFQVSRGPIREALRILEKDGVVRIVPNRGAQVTQLTADELNEIFEVRAALTQLAVRHLCRTGDAAARKNFFDGIARLAKLARNEKDLDGYINESYGLTGLMATSSNNARLSEMLGSLARQTIRYTVLGLRRSERRKASATTWQEVAAAVRDRDEDLSSRLIVELITESQKAAVAELEREAAEKKQAEDT